MKMTISRSGVYAFLFLMMGILAFACSPFRYTSSIDGQDNAGEEKPRILFLNYMISRDSTTSIYSAQLISMILRDGSIKNTKGQSSQAKKNDLTLKVLDKNQQLMTSQYIPNPLDKSVEYVNDARQLERKMIHLDSAQFSVRLQIEPGASSIVLNRIIGDDQEEGLLLKTSIR